MKPIIFNCNDSFLDRASEAIGLKAGYLLGDDVYAAGSTFIDLFYAENMQKMSFDKKLSFLRNRLQDEERIEVIEQAIKMSKMAKKIKHKTPEQVAFNNRFQKMLNRCIEQEIEETQDYMHASGFDVVKDLMKEEAIKHYLINVSAQPVVPGLSITASHLLQRLLPHIKEDEEPEIFFLGPEFFRDDYSEPCVYIEADTTAYDKLNISLYRCFTLPDFTAFTTDELKQFRMHLQQSGALFREKINEWIDICYFGDEIPARISFFTNEVLPAAHHLQECIDGYKIGNFYHGNDDTERIEIWIGEMPVHEIWDYYDQYNVIPDGSWSKLETLKNAGEYSDERWPVLVLNVPQSTMMASEEEDKTPAEEITTSKKYLIID